MAIAADPREEHGRDIGPSEEGILSAWLLPNDSRPGYKMQLNREEFEIFQTTVSPELKLGFHFPYGVLSILEGWSQTVAEVFDRKIVVNHHAEVMSPERQYFIGKAPDLSAITQPALAVRKKAGLPQDYEAMHCMKDEMTGRYVAVQERGSVLVGITKTPFTVRRDSRLSFNYK